MKKIFLLVLIFWVSNLSIAQEDPYSRAADFFLLNFNTGKYDLIFENFSQEMKKAVPLENTKQFLTDVRNQAGKIEGLEFLNFQQGTYAAYKTSFEKSLMTLLISLDDQNKIDGLYIKPYVNSAQTGETTFDNLDGYPEEIRTIIFAKTKDLPNNARLSIALIQNGEVKNYGVQKNEDNISPDENHRNLFEIGSITKVFTSTVLTSLVLDNQVGLNEEINPYFDFQFKDDRKLTFESLSNHTSGLPRLPENLDLSIPSIDENPYKDYGEKELEVYLRELMDIKNEDLGIFEYSNLGVGLLGYTLGLSQKTSFQSLLQTEVFDKYGLNQSYTSSEHLGDRLIKGLDYEGYDASNWEFGALFGGGGIISSTEDLSKFALAQFNPENLDLALTRQPTIQLNENSAIGLGWHIELSKNKNNLYWHNGGTGGYSSCMVLNVDKKLGVIVLSNVSGINETIDELSFELLQVLKKSTTPNPN
jgi:CubicO group peptidase (beta-lactamase class C family)